MGLSGDAGFGLPDSKTRAFLEEEGTGAFESGIFLTGIGCGEQADPLSSGKPDYLFSRVYLSNTVPSCFMALTVTFLFTTSTTM
jgi:hypothetical protein